MNLSLFLHFVKLIIKSQMEYRADFLLGALGQVIGYAAKYLVIWLLISTFEEINGWGWNEIAFLYSFNLLAYAIGASFTYTPMGSLEQFIVNGNLDQYLTKPLPPFIYYLARLFNIGYVAHIFISLAIMIWAISQSHVDWSVIKIGYLVLAIISASFLHGAIITFIGAMSFTFIRVKYLFSIYSKMREFIAYPISIYGIVLQFILTWIVPLGMINYYPSLVLLEKSEQGISAGFYGMISIILGPLCFYISYKLWNRNLGRYEGAGG